MCQAWCLTLGERNEQDSLSWSWKSNHVADHTGENRSTPGVSANRLLKAVWHFPHQPPPIYKARSNQQALNSEFLVWRASSSSKASNLVVQVGQCISRTSKTHRILQKGSILITKSLGISWPSSPYNSVSEKPSGQFSKDKLLGCLGGAVG